MQPALEKILGQPVIVENRAGAGGTLGVDAVAKAAPDGYTIGLAGAGALGVNIGERTKRMYDPAKDLAPISRAAESPFILIATPSRREDAGRRRQARQGRARPHLDRPRRQRHGDATRRDDVREDGRRENQSGALSRHGAGGDRRDRRPCPARHCRSAALDGRDRRRQAQGDRGVVEAALFGVSGCADLLRARPEGFRADRLVRHRRAEGDAARDRRQAQRGGGRGAEGPRGRAAHPHRRHGADADDAGGLSTYLEGDIAKAARVAPVVDDKPN